MPSHYTLETIDNFTVEVGNDNDTYNYQCSRCDRVTNRSVNRSSDNRSSARLHIDA